MRILVLIASSMFQHSMSDLSLGSSQNATRKLKKDTPVQLDEFCHSFYPPPAPVSQSPPPLPPPSPAPGGRAGGGGGGPPPSFDNPPGRPPVDQPAVQAARRLRRHASSARTKENKDSHEGVSSDSPPLTRG
jgi:hypothetical protein